MNDEISDLLNTIDDLNEYIANLESGVATLVRDWPRRKLSPAVTYLQDLVEEQTGRDLVEEGNKLEGDEGRAYL